MLEFLSKGILVHGAGLTAFEFLDSWVKAKAIALTQDIDVLPADAKGWDLLHSIKPSEHAKARYLKTIEMSDCFIVNRLVGDTPYLTGYWLFEARYWGLLKRLKWLWRHRHG